MVLPRHGSIRPPTGFPKPTATRLDQLLGVIQPSQRSVESSGLLVAFVGGGGIRFLERVRKPVQSFRNVGTVSDGAQERDLFPAQGRRSLSIALREQTRSQPESPGKSARRTDAAPDALCVRKQGISGCRIVTSPEDVAASHKAPCNSHCVAEAAPDSLLLLKQSQRLIEIGRIIESRRGCRARKAHQPGLADTQRGAAARRGLEGVTRVSPAGETCLSGGLSRQPPQPSRPRQPIGQWPPRPRAAYVAPRSGGPPPPCGDCAGGAQPLACPGTSPIEPSGYSHGRTARARQERRPLSSPSVSTASPLEALRHRRRLVRCRAAHAPGRPGTRAPRPCALRGSRCQARSAEAS